MAQPMFGAETVAFLRRNGAMQAIVKWLEIDPNEKTLNIAVSCIKLLCSGSAEEKVSAGSLLHPSKYRIP
jgi:hypothetical protein